MSSHLPNLPSQDDEPVPFRLARLPVKQAAPLRIGPWLLPLAVITVLSGLVSIVGIIGTLAMAHDQPEASPQARNAMAAYQPVTEFMYVNFSKTDPRITAHAPIFVIHETTTDAKWIADNVNRANYRASFHAFIPRTGNIVLMVPATRTAWTAGKSKFLLEPGDTERRHKVNPRDPDAEWDDSGMKSATVNHFAFQVELESPPDGYWCTPTASGTGCGTSGRGATHSGYTEAQYRALAWLAAQTGIPEERITSHAQVDITGTRKDPRSFDWPHFWDLLRAVPKQAPTISLGIPTHPETQPKKKPWSWLPDVPSIFRPPGGEAQEKTPEVPKAPEAPEPMPHPQPKPPPTEPSLEEGR